MGGRPTAARSGAARLPLWSVHREMAIRALLSPPSTPARRGCGSCGNPWAVDGGGISNGCGKVRARVAGGPELSTSGQLPQPGWGKASSARRPVQACMRACVAACGLACRPACGSAEPRAELRAGLREPRADLRAVLRGRIVRPHPPSLAFGSALSRIGIFGERNETRGIRIGQAG
jgi:hypothetical protein